MKTQIEEKIKKHIAPDGRSLFELQTSYKTSNGDESGIETHSWVKWDERENEETQERDSLLIADLTNMFVDHKNNNAIMVDENSYINDGLNHTYHTIDNDMYKLHISDQSIHLIIFYSGQY